MHGGLAQGIGQALLEGCVYDKETGQLLTGSYNDYAMPRAADFPWFSLSTNVTPCTHNPLGVKGCGEAGAIGAPAALTNAIVDALKPLGVRHLDMPATPSGCGASSNSTATARRGLASPGMKPRTLMIVTPAKVGAQGRVLAAYSRSRERRITRRAPMYEFNYHKPTSLDEIANLLGANEEAKLVAGGMTLIPTLKLRLAKPSDLVDLAAIPSLRGITDAGDAVVIGAMTRHGEVHNSPVVKQGIPALAAMAGLIGDPAVRNRGTIGGSISNNDPAADYPAALVALNATVHTTKREIPAESFFTGMFETALEPTEIVTSVRFPKTQTANYQKFRNPASRYAIVGVFVARTPGGVRVAVTGAGPSVFRVPEMEAALAQNPSPRTRSRTSRSPTPGSTPTSTPQPSIVLTSSASWPGAPLPPAPNLISGSWLTNRSSRLG